MGELFKYVKTYKMYWQSHQKHAIYSYWQLQNDGNTFTHGVV